MKERVQGCVTAGVALLGAGVMAVSPVTPQAPEVLRAQVALAAQPITEDPADALAGAAGNVAEFGERFASSFVTAPLGVLAIAAAIAEDSGDAALYEALKAFISGPQYVLDPLVFAFDDISPPPLGGDTATDPTKMDGSAISDFRADVLLAARNDVLEAVADSFGIGKQDDVDDEGAVYAAARLAGGLSVSALRAATSTVTAPLGLVALAQAVAAGDEEGVYDALQAYIDGPNYVLDPIVFAIDDVLPAPAGSDIATDPTKMDGSAVSNFRANVLLAPRDAVREAVAAPLGVDPVTGEEVQTAQTEATLRSAQGTADVEKSEALKQERPTKRFFSSLKENAEEASDRAEERRAERAEAGAKHRAETKKAFSGLRKAVRDAVSPPKPKANNGNDGATE